MHRKTKSSKAEGHRRMWK